MSFQMRSEHFKLEMHSCRNQVVCKNPLETIKGYLYNFAIVYLGNCFSLQVEDLSLVTDVGFLVS